MHCGLSQPRNYYAKGSIGAKGFTNVKGFTLIEVLVVIMIFSIITVMTFQSFQGLLSVNQRSVENFEHESKLQRTWSMLLADLLQLNARPVRDILGGYEAAYQTNIAGYVMRFTRGGVVPFGDQQAIQRIAYSVTNNGDLTRWVWPVLDATSEAEPIAQVLLSDVKTLVVEQLNLSGDYETLWPPLNVTMPRDALPRMIRITLETTAGVQLQRVIPGVQPFDNSSTDKDARALRFPMIEQAEQAEQANSSSI